MPSTEQVLAALRRAHAAQLSILANSTPVKPHTVSLQHASGSAQERYDDRSLDCIQLEFSRSGSHAAAVLQHTGQCNADNHKWELLPYWYHTYELVVFDTAEAWHEQARIQCKCSRPVLHWSGTAPHLGIALQSRVRDDINLPRAPVWDELPKPTPKTAAFVLDLSTA